MQPDITLLVLDTQRVDRLSCYGYPVEISPHLDKFARDATLFTHAISPSQWTIPAHASMFTGVHSLQHVLWDVESVLSPTTPTMAERLSQADYFTVGFSNNHLIGSRLNNGLNRGFKVFINYGRSRKVSRTDAPESSTLQARVLRAVVHSAALKKFLLLPQVRPLAKALFWNDKDIKGNTAQSLSDAAQFMIDRPDLSPNQPLFTFINLMGVHTPYDPPGWAVERFAPQFSNGNVEKRLKNFDAELRGTSSLLSAQSSSDWLAILNGLYDAQVAAQDVLLGDFFDRIRDAGVLDNTLFIVVSDHGEHLGEKQLLGHSFGAYRELLHVPLLIRDPLGNLPHGTTWDTCVSTRRVFHTALTAAGIATSEEEALNLARSGAKDIDQPFVFAESQLPREARAKTERDYPGLLKVRGYDETHLTVYGTGYKLIMAGESCIGLYDICDDPTESRDLQQTMPDEVEALCPHIQDFVRQSGDVIPGMEAEIDDVVMLERLRALGYID